MQTDHPPIRCFACGYAFDCGSALDNDDVRPYAGAISLCLNCGNLGIFEGDPVASIREMTKEEFIGMRQDAPSEYAQMQRAVAIIRDRGPLPHLSN